MTGENLPLLVFQPALGANQEWIGIRVLGDGLATPGVLPRLIDEFGLGQSTAGLPFMLEDGLIPRLEGISLPDGVLIQAYREVASSAPPPAPFSGPRKTLLLRILGQIASEAETREIETTLKQDPQLSVQLLRLVNSVAFAPYTQISSFAHAITLLGRRQLQRWLQLLLYASQTAGSQGNPLLAKAALRATLMESLRKAMGGDRAAQDQAFMVGMFSQLEALFMQPLAAIIGPLKLGEEVSSALLLRAGTLGDLLTAIESAEHGPEAVAPVLARAGISNETWCKAQLEGLSWALQVSRDS